MSKYIEDVPFNTLYTSACKKACNCKAYEEENKTLHATIDELKLVIKTLAKQIK